MTRHYAKKQVDLSMSTIFGPTKYFLLIKIVCIKYQTRLVLNFN